MRDVSVSRGLFGSAAAKFQGKESIEVNNVVYLQENAGQGISIYLSVFIGLFLFYQNKSIHLWIKDMRVMHGCDKDNLAALQQNFAP